MAYLVHSAVLSAEEIPAEWPRWEIPGVSDLGGLRLPLVATLLDVATDFPALASLGFAGAVHIAGAAPLSGGYHLWVIQL